MFMRMKMNLVVPKGGLEPPRRNPLESRRIRIITDNLRPRDERTTRISHTLRSEFGNPSTIWRDR